MTQQFPRKLIVDADTGIDDAMALVLALDAHKRGEADVRAVTCVAGNTAVENSLVNVLRILDVMGCPEARSSYIALRIFFFFEMLQKLKIAGTMTQQFQQEGLACCKVSLEFSLICQSKG